MSATSSSASVSASSKGLVNTDNPVFKIVGVCLAVGSGLFIGTSFVVKKLGLIRSTAKHGNQAGEGHGYLKSPLWWSGMTLMIIGEILNFVAYAFTVAILVTPMGSISVVVSAILSHFLLKETLTLFGWIGCTLCIMGSIILALNAPEEGTTRTIDEFQKLFVSPGFLTWAGVCIIASLVIVFYLAPKYGKKTMMCYISVCSLIGGISVSCTQGLGAAIVTSIQGDNQVKHWFFWFLFVFVVITLLVEINYLNKALELFNTSMVVPVYFCYFTSATMITSFILYRGLKAKATVLITMVLGFLVTCLGITLLQMSKVDPTQLKGLDRRTTLLLEASRHQTEEQEKGNITAMEDPGMDALRGGFGAVGSVIRARSMSRRLSNASALSAERNRHGSHSTPTLNTGGIGGLERYQLTDNPMPSNDLESIALSPTRPQASRPSSPFGTSYTSFGTPVGTPGRQPTRSSSALKFEDNDVVHKYGYTRKDGQHTDATHSVRHHGSHDDLRHTAAFNAMADHLPSVLEAAPIVESPLAENPEKLKFPNDLRPATDYLDPYYGEAVVSPTPSEADPLKKPSIHNLFTKFGHHHSDSKDSQVRGGGHRGVKDYPHLAREEHDIEKEQRRALVSADDDQSSEGHGLSTSPQVTSPIAQATTGLGLGMPGYGAGLPHPDRDNYSPEELTPGLPAPSALNLPPGAGDSVFAPKTPSPVGGASPAGPARNARVPEASAATGAAAAGPPARRPLGPR